MECPDIRQLADAFVAGELRTETIHAVYHHLERCLACRADINSRSALRTRLQDALLDAPSLGPKPEFMSGLRTRLQAEAQRVQAHRAVRIPGWLALAAVLVLTVAVGVVFRQEWFPAARTVVQAAVGDHENCALQFRLKEKPITLEEAARRDDAVYRVFQAVPQREIATVSGSARVLERHSCVYAGRRFAHIVLEYQGRKVSLLATASAGAGRAGWPVGGSSRPMATAPIDGMSVVLFETTRYTIVLTGSVSATDITSLAEAVAQPLHDALGA